MSIDAPGWPAGNGVIQLAHESTLDNFVIDNVVVFFKNRSTGLPTFEQV